MLGLGYIGLPTSLLLAQNFEVIGVDINNDVVEKLNSGQIPFKEPGLNDLFLKVKNNFRASTNVDYADVFLIAVPTPLDKSVKVADLKHVQSAARMIFPYLKEGNLVILESTVPPGSSEQLVAPILGRSGLKQGDFGLVHCPERAIPGNTIYEMIHNDRIIGGFDYSSLDRAKEIYASFVRGNLYLTDIRTAELVKLMENSYRDINIALANEFAQIAEECKINIWEAIFLANKHPRVNILKPGPGVGGHCISIDPWFLTEGTTKCRMVSLAREINDSMPNYVLKIVRELLDKINEPTITVLGVSYKGNVDDTRETPALKFIKLAENEGFNVKVHDPYVKVFYKNILNFNEAVMGSDCIIVMTDHDIFKNIKPEHVSNIMRNKNLVDTRSIFNIELWKKAGFNIRVLGDGKQIP